MKHSAATFLRIVAAGFLLTVAAVATPARASNPIDPLGTYFADPEPHVWADGTIYLYCSHDATPGVWCSDNYHVLSSSDLIHWKDNGPSFQIPGSILYACECAYRNGRYYLYYATPDGKEFVAAGSHPTGPFTQATQIAGISGIDPGVLVDDDGQAYLYWGQRDKVRAAKLKPDMTQIDPATVIQPLNVAQDNFHEGSAVVKRNGIYYYVYADTSRHGHRPTCLGYATGTSPLGPFTYRGVIIDSFGCDPKVWNNHGRIAEFHGRWYVFYHRSTHDGGYLRQTCMEPITFNADGTIPEVEMTTQGVGKPLPATTQIEAAIACNLSGTVHNEDCQEGGLDLGAAANGDYAAYKNLDFGRGVAQFTARAANGGTGGILEIHLDDPSGPLAGSCPVPFTGGWQTWATFTCALHGATGVHALYLKFVSDSDAKTLSVKWFRFSGSGRAK